MPDDWWNHLYCIDRKEDRSFLPQVQGRRPDDWWNHSTCIDREEVRIFRKIPVRPIEDFFPIEITDTSRAFLREQLKRLSEERELTMPFKHETYSSPTLTGGIFIDNIPRPKIKNVIFNDPATIVFWTDGTKTVVKCENEEFDKEKGLALAYMKKMLGNKGRYFNEVKKWTR